MGQLVYNRVTNTMLTAIAVNMSNERTNGHSIRQFSCLAWRLTKNEALQRTVSLNESSFLPFTSVLASPPSSDRSNSWPMPVRYSILAVRAVREIMRIDRVRMRERLFVTVTSTDNFARLYEIILLDRQKKKIWKYFICEKHIIYIYIAIRGMRIKIVICRHN